jgi:DNA-binding MarR family transcriptional regulator
LTNPRQFALGEARSSWYDICVPHDLPLERVIQVADFRAGLRAFESRSEQASRRNGLTPQRYLLLLQVKGAADASERVSFGVLADRLKISPNAATELVTRAEQAGLVRRERSQEDGRVVFVRLTEEGERRLRAVLEENEQHRRELSQAFDALAQSLEPR